MATCLIDLSFSSMGLIVPAASGIFLLGFLAGLAAWKIDPPNAAGSSRSF